MSDSRPKLDTVIETDLREFAILGGGPVGMINALLLARSGLKVKIFDSRAGTYFRPGHLSQETFDMVERTLGIELYYTPPGHIKDLERQLYSEILKYKDKGIEIIREDFKALSKDEKGIITEEGNFYPAQAVISCTGGKRAMVQAVNEEEGQDYFEVNELVPNNPVKKHLLAHVVISADDARILESINTNNTPPLMDKLASTFAEFRARFNWPYFSPPFVYFMSYPKKNDSSKSKIIIYSEITEDLKDEEKEIFLAYSLKLKAGRDIPFTKISPTAVLDDNGVKAGESLPHAQKIAAKNRLRLMKFTANPTITTPFTYQSKTGLPVFLGGDELLTAHHQLSEGIKNGLKNALSLCAEMTIEKNCVTQINMPNYIARLNNLIEERKSLINITYDKRNSEIFSADYQKLKIYEIAIQQTDGKNPAFIQEKDKILLEQIERENSHNKILRELSEAKSKKLANSKNEEAEQINDKPEKAKVLQEQAREISFDQELLELLQDYGNREDQPSASENAASVDSSSEASDDDSDDEEANDSSNTNKAYKDSIYGTARQQRYQDLVPSLFCTITSRILAEGTRLIKAEFPINSAEKKEKFAILLAGTMTYAMLFQDHQYGAQARYGKELNLPLNQRTPQLLYPHYSYKQLKEQSMKKNIMQLGRKVIVKNSLPFDSRIYQQFFPALYLSFGLQKFFDQFLHRNIESSSFSKLENAELDLNASMPSKKSSP